MFYETLCNPIPTNFFSLLSYLSAFPCPQTLAALAFSLLFLKHDEFRAWHLLFSLPGMLSPYLHGWLFLICQH